MRIAYLFNENPAAATEMKCERVYADTDKTDRTDLDYLINRGGVVAGDVVCVRQISDFGKGKGGARIASQLEELGVTIEVIPTKEKREARGRPREFEPTPEQRKAMEIIWYESVHGMTRALERMSEEAGRKITKAMAYRLFGTRKDGPKPKKRKAK